MKIVHFIPVLTKGGAERVAVDLANAAVADGHEVTVLAAYPVDEKLLKNRLSSEVEVRFMSGYASGRILRYVASLRWLLSHWNWLGTRDILHCHLTQASALGALIYFLRRLRGGTHPAVIETYHAVGMPIPAWHRQIHAWLCTRHDGVVFMAKDRFWSEFIRRHPRLRTVHIPNGVDSRRGKENVSSQLDYRSSVGIPSSCKLVVGTVGQFRKERVPHLVVDVFARLARKFPDNMHFLMVGDGLEHASTLAWIKSEGLEARIHAPGLSYNALLPMSVMDLYLTLNVGPITGIAALEAVFVGVPVVALQLDATFNPKSDDWIWSSHDVHVVVEFMAELLNDAESRVSLGNRQLAHAESWHTVSAMHLAYFGFYTEVLSGLRRDGNV